jgi:hypothetical protein
MNDNSVAAVIPTYNRAAILRRSIESALRQSHPVKEIIVVDDGSTDQTAQVVSQYSSRIHYVVQRNAGGAAARNRGVAMAQSKWIAFLDSDDEWLPHKTEMQLAALESCKAEFCCGPYWIHHVDGSRELVTPRIPLLPAIRLRNLFSPSVAMVSRRVFLQHNGFREDLRSSCEDWELFCRMAQDCACAASASPIVNYYLSQSSISHDPRIMMPATLSIVESLLTGLRGPSRMIWRQKIRAAMYYRGSVSFRHCHGSGLHYLLLSLLHWPVPDARVKSFLVETLDLLREPGSVRRRLSGAIE